MTKTRDELKKLSGADHMLRPGTGLDNPYRAEIELLVKDIDVEALLKMLVASCENFFIHGYELGKKECEQNDRQELK